VRCSSNDDDGILGAVPDVDDITDIDDIDDITDIDDVDDIDGDVTGDPATPAAAGSFTITFTNTAEFQPMTPPVVALHTSVADGGSIALFEVNTQAADFIIPVAEDGNNGPIVDVVNGQIAAGTIGSGGVAFPDPENPGPLMPGDSASITLDAIDDNQSLSFVSMVVCTNDGFSGANARPLAEETFMAGSESNVLMLDYFVPPCNPGNAAGSPNIGDEENGVITAHPGQSGTQNPDFDFTPETAAAGLLEVTITAN